MSTICTSCRGTGYSDYLEDKDTICLTCGGIGTLAVAQVPRNPFDWMQSWVDAYERNVGDGKAKAFIEWVNNQPMAAG
jgi:DnaJ-class molecular chaperone